MMRFRLRYYLLTGKHLPRVARFAGAGLLATGAHWIVMAVLVVSGLPALAATVAGSMAGAVTNYVLQHRLTFHDRHKHPDQAGRYVMACMLLWLGNALVFFLGDSVMLLPVWISQVLATVATAVLSFHVFRSLVFIGEVRS